MSTISLKNLALTATAVRLWSTYSARKLIKTFFSENENNIHMLQPSKRTWKIIEAKVIDAVLASECVKHEFVKVEELRDIIKIIGWKIFFWTKYVVLDLNLDFKWAEEIYWTAAGSVDEVKIYKYVWFPHPDFNRSKRKLSQIMLPSFRMGGLFLPEDFVVNNNLNLLGKVIKSLNLHLKGSEELKIIYDQVHAELKKLRMLRTLHSTMKLFFLSIYCGYENVVKYLAHKVIDINYLHYFLNLAMKVCLENGKCVKNYYLKEKFVNIFIFLKSKMLIKHKKIMLPSFLQSEADKILELLTDVWPFQEEECSQVLDYFSLNGSTEELYSKLQNFMNTRYLNEHCKPLTSLQKPIGYKILKTLMSKLPRELKIDFFVEDTVMNKMFKALDFHILKLIISDNDLLDQRNNLIELGSGVFWEFIKEGNYEVFESFIEKVLQPDDKKIVVQQKINFLLGLITAEKFEIADEYLNYVPISEEKKFRIKIRIDLMKICSLLSEEGLNSELIKKLLKNKALDEEKKKMLTKIYDALLNGLCIIWCKKFKINRYEAEETLSHFLNMFLKPKKMEHFKKEKLLVNDNFIQIFCSHLMDPEDFEIIDELFKFFSITTEDIKEIKSKIIENLDWWIDLYVLKEKNFLMIHYIVNWIFEDALEKQETIESFMNSDTGVLLCFEIIKDEVYDQKIKSETFTFLHSWVKPRKNVDALLVRINEMGYDDVKKNYVISVIQSLYDEMMDYENFENRNEDLKLEDSDIELQKVLMADVLSQQIKADDDSMWFFDDD